MNSFQAEKVNPSKAEPSLDKKVVSLRGRLVVVNVVATADLNQSVNPVMVGQLPFCSYDPEVYHCIYIQAPDMFSKVSVFTTGKMISSGTKNEKSARHDLKFVADYLARARLIMLKRPRIKIQNIVASVEFENPVKLAEIVREVPHIIYEPDQFPGAIYYPRDPIGVSILLFASGKAVIAGAKDMCQLRLAVMDLEHIVSMFEQTGPTEYSRGNSKSLGSQEGEDLI
jgi:transcription initiation factor TFIID TATA-box-binding protein